MTIKKEYSQDQTFHRGDVIYHPVFDDEGKIKKIELAANRVQKLWVDFEAHGSKILVAGISASDKSDKGE